MSDEFYMQKALILARKGRGWTSPNPLVGAVIVKDGQIIGNGYHKKFGDHHAEVNAINSASKSTEGATFYITLEPCSHYGKTPPCVDRIIAAGAARVVIGIADPNPLVSGRGIEILTNHGIETTVGVLEEECRELNDVFFKFMETGIPFITLKYAQTLDGRIATASGHSQWISSVPSRKFVHRLRSRHDGILVGIGTVLQDDPELTVRLVRGRNPVRIVVDPFLDIPLNAQILQNQNDARTIIATTASCDKKKESGLKHMRIEMIVVDQTNGNYMDLKELFGKLGKRDISSVFVEGGAGIITSLIRDRIPDRMFIITAPKIAGKGIEAVGDLGIKTMDESVQLRYERVFRKGNDIIFDARIEQ